MYPKVQRADPLRSVPKTPFSEATPSRSQDPQFEEQDAHTRPQPYCFKPNVVLFKSHAKNFKVWFSLFFQRTVYHSFCFLHNLFSFEFWASLTSKNDCDKPCCSSLECSLTSEYDSWQLTRKSQKRDQYGHALSDFSDFINHGSLYLPPNVCVLFVPKIFVKSCKPTLFTFALSLYWTFTMW